MAEILKELEERYDFLVQKYGEDHILGIFLYGSQNYGMSTPESDIDTKAIYVPSMMEICMNKKPISKELHYKGTHIEIKDIRLMCEMWKKQNINFIEILFTEYTKVNPLYYPFWVTLRQKRERIARYDPQKTVISVSSQAFHTIRHGEVTGKQFANAGRLVYFLKHYLEGYAYDVCIKMNEDSLAHFLEYKKSNQLYGEDNEELTQIRNELEAFTKLKVSNEYGEIERDYLDKAFAYFCMYCIHRCGNE